MHPHLLLHALGRQPLHGRQPTFALCVQGPAQEAPALVALVAGIKCCRAVVEDLCAEKVSLVWVVQNVFRCAPLKCIISHQSAPGPQQLQAFKSNSSFGVLACVHTALSPTLHTMQWPRRPHGFSSSLPSCSAHQGPDLGHNSHYAVTRTSTSPEGMAVLTAVTGRHRPSPAVTGAVLSPMLLWPVWSLSKTDTF